MAKDKRINDIPGISGAAIVQLTRIGIETIHDLLHADFDRVAYVLEDYKEATRLITEAQKVGKSKSEPKKHAKPSDGHHADHVVPPKPHVAPEPRSSEPRTEARSEARVEHRVEQRATETRTREGGKHEPTTLKFGEHAAEKGPALSAEGPLSIALGLAARGVSLADASDHEPRLALARRLAVTDLLLRYGGSESELIAGLLTEAVESGAVSPQEALARFGPDIWRVLEQATALRAVPLLPSGKPPKYYTEMATSALLPARRVCAAFLTQSLASGGPESISLFHARLLLDALKAGGSDDLVDLAAAAVDHAASEQAARLAA